MEEIEDAIKEEKKRLVTDTVNDIINDDNTEREFYEKEAFEEKSGPFSEPEFSFDFNQQKNKNKTFLDYFCQTFDQYSYNNGLYGRLCAHVLLGQKLRDIRIYFGPFYVDPRISIFIMQPSGTGKSVAYDLINSVGKSSNIKMNDIGEATDAALVGCIEQEEVIDEETGKKVTVYNAKTGLLASSDILYYDEGKMLVTKQQYSQNTLAWLQKSLNPIGSGQNRCTKNLAHGDPIEFHPRCSLLITSHDIQTLMEQILETGFFQRIVLYPRYIPIGDREENELKRSNRFGIQINTKIDETQLSEELNKIGEMYQNHTVKVDSKCYPIIRSEINKVYNEIEQSHERVREIMATFAPRYNNLMYIFAFHHSAANYRDIINVDDIKYGADLMKQLLKEVMTWVEEKIAITKLTNKEQAFYNSLVQIYNAMDKSDDGFVPKVALIKNCQYKWGISVNTVVRYFDKFKGFRKMIEVKGKKSILMVKLETPKFKGKKK